MKTVKNILAGLAVMTVVTLSYECRAMEVEPSVPGLNQLLQTDEPFTSFFPTEFPETPTPTPTPCNTTPTGSSSYNLPWRKIFAAARYIDPYVLFASISGIIHKCSGPWAKGDLYIPKDYSRSYKKFEVKNDGVHVGKKVIPCGVFPDGVTFKKYTYLSDVDVYLDYKLIGVIKRDASKGEKLFRPVYKKAKYFDMTCALDGKLKYEKNYFDGTYITKE